MVIFLQLYLVTNLLFGVNFDWLSFFRCSLLLTCCLEWILIGYFSSVVPCYQPVVKSGF